MKRNTSTHILIPRNEMRLSNRGRSWLGSNKTDNKIDFTISDSSDTFVSSYRVAERIIQQLASLIDNKIQEIQSKRYKEYLIQLCKQIQENLQMFICPQEQASTENQTKIPHEPLTTQDDTLCGGTSISIEHLLPSKVIIPHRQSIEQTNNTSFTKGLFQKESNTSRMSKQKNSIDLTFKKKSFRLLDLPNCYQQDQAQQLLRQKLQKQNSLSILTSIKRSSQTLNPFKIAKKIAIEKIKPTSQISNEFSYDYDGSLFPIAKSPKRNNDQVKILNATCKIITKQMSKNRKAGLIQILHHTDDLFTAISNKKEKKKDEDSLIIDDTATRRNTPSIPIRNFFKSTNNFGKTMSKIQLARASIRIRQISDN